MFRNFLKTRRIRLKLEQLDDRMLQDIGIARSDIDRIARGEIPRHRVHHDHWRTVL